MIKKSEILAILISLVVLAIVLAFNGMQLETEIIGECLLVSAVIIGVSVFAKKAVARYIDVECELSIWQWRRYWISKRSEFKNPIPFGILLPLLFAFITGGFFKFLAFLEFKATALPSKAVKKYGLSRYSGIMEWDDSLLVFYSTLAVLAVSIASSFFDSAGLFFSILSKYSLYYALYNLIPLSNLDGTRLLFGSRPLYILTLVIAAVSTLVVFF